MQLCSSGVRRPVFRSVAHRAAGSIRPQCHGMRNQLCRRAASGPSSHPSLTGPRGRAAHSVMARGIDCHGAGVLPPARLQFCRSPGRRVRPPTSIATAGAERLACFLLVSLPARQVSTSRRLGYQHSERTVSKLCHRRFLKPVAGLFDFQPCAGYAGAPLPRSLSGAAGFTGAFTLLFLSLLRT